MGNQYTKSNKEKLLCATGIEATDFTHLMKAILKNDINLIKENLHDINAVNSKG